MIRIGCLLVSRLVSLASRYQRRQEFSDNDHIGETDTALYAFDGTWNEDEPETEQETNVVRFKRAYQGGRT